MLKNVLHRPSVVYTRALKDHRIRIALGALKWKNPWCDHKFRGLLIFQTQIDISCHFSHSDRTFTLFIYSFSIFHVIGFVLQCAHEWHAGRARDNARWGGWDWEWTGKLWLLAKRTWTLQSWIRRLLKTHTPSCSTYSVSDLRLILVLKMDRWAFPAN